MIKVLYIGCCYVQLNNTDLSLREETHREYKNYFQLDCDVIDELEHFDSCAVHHIKFIPDKLPKGITNEMIESGAIFVISSYKASFCAPIILTNEKIKAGETVFYGRFSNKLKIFLNDNAPPVQQGNTPKAKVSINQDRDNDCIAWIETEKPPLDNMTRQQVHDALIARNSRLWASGFSDWCRQQKIITFKPGKPKKQR